MLCFVIDYFSPGLLTDLPHYDIIYSIGGYYSYNGNSDENSRFGLNITVKNRKINMFYRGSCYYTPPKVYIFHTHSRQSMEIGITPFNNYNDLLKSGDERCGDGSVNYDDPTKITAITIPELAILSVSTSVTAPDGYTFLNQEDEEKEKGLIASFFSGSARKNHNLAWIKKGMYKIRLPNTGIEYDYYSKADFIGWVIP